MVTIMVKAVNLVQRCNKIWTDYSLVAVLASQAVCAPHEVGVVITALFRIRFMKLIK